MTPEEAIYLLPEYLLGTLPEGEMAVIDALLETSPELEAELATLADGYACFAEALPPVAPPPEVKARLLAAARGPERFGPFLAQMGRYCGLAVEKMREVVALVDQLSAWEPGPLPEIAMIHFAGGPNALGTDTGFVRFAPGFKFPLHSHTAYEVNFVLEGALIDDDGAVYGPGQALEKDPTMVHAWKADPEHGVLVLAVYTGFEVLGPHPEDP